MSTTKHLREIRRAITEAGGKLIGVTHKRHLKLTVEFGARRRTIVCSVSPSDGNALANVKRDVERIARECAA